MRPNEDTKISEYATRDERVVRANEGCREAIGELVREHYGRVFRFCARRVGEDLAADAAQETFVTMQSTISRYQGRSEFSTWLLGIANNHCRNLVRKKRPEVPLEDWFEGTESHEAAVVERQTLSEALKKLSEEHREVVLLHEVDGLKYCEIAQMIGVPEGTVKSRLFHAFRQLRAHLCEVTA